jgi:hypothetical protein
MAKKPNTSTTADGDDETADVSTEELKGAANAGAADKTRSKNVQAQAKAMEPDRTPLKEGEHLPGDFRFRVENTAAGDLNMDPREPYPTGNPPDPKEEFYRINGHYPGEKTPAEENVKR